MSIESRVTNTGPAPAVMAPMVVDMAFAGRCFGKLQLPQVNTSPSGCDVKVYDQDIHILDLDAYMAFVKALVTQESLTLALDNGKCQITAMRFLKGNCTYKKDVVIKGMNGPASKIKTTTADMNTMQVHNPSPVDIDHGHSRFDIQAADGSVIAELEGPMRIAKGDGEVTMKITRKMGAPLTGEGIKLVGRGTDGQAWTDASVKYIQVPLLLTEEFRSFYETA